MQPTTSRRLLATSLLLASLCLALDGGRSVAEPAQTRGIATAAGTLEIPRYIRYRELDPKDPFTVLITPTLQRCRAGKPVVLEKGKEYLYAVEPDGTLLVGEKAPFGTCSEAGHPNLTGGKRARMSGELRYDPKTDSVVIDNDSGRYGFNTGRQRCHLDAARALFDKVGVVLTDGRRPRLSTRWIKPWRTPEVDRMDEIRPFLKGAPQGFDVAGWRRGFLSRMRYPKPQCSTNGDCKAGAHKSAATTSTRAAAGSL